MNTIVKSEIDHSNSSPYDSRIPMNAWAEDDIPSEKLLLKGSMSLSDAELLSIVIGSGIIGENSLDIAMKVLSICGNNLCEFWKFSISDLQKIKDAGALLEISVLDHIIVGNDRFYSFADEGAM